MSAHRANPFLKGCLIVYTLIFWCTGIALVFLGIYMITEPKRSYILDLVDFSEDDPLLRFAAYASIITGVATLLVGFLSCCGSIKSERCMIASFLIFLVFIFIAEISIGILGVLYRNKIASPIYSSHLKGLVQSDYGVYQSKERNRQITRMVDKLQFHMNCCGAQSPNDWTKSQWLLSVPTNTFIFDSGSPSLVISNKLINDEDTSSSSSPNVPDSCCVQMQDATVNNRIARSLVRCQQSGASRLWRHQIGCHERLQQWFDEQSVIFAAIGFSFAVFQIIGMCISVVLWRNLSDYKYVNSN